ncbi:MAG: glycosyltransferase [Firmicutes bacterium]|nr:glycosyltransferase [Bacillota bacterium]
MKKQILCLSTSNYHPIPTRKQNIMNRLTDCDIIYVDPPVSYIAPLKDPKAKARINSWKEAPERIREGLWVYANKPVLPFANKKRAVNEINQKRLAKYYAKLCRDHGFSGDFTVWCYHPQCADLIAPLAHELGIAPAKLWKQTVYDCVDRHSAYPGLIDRETVDEMEADLARSCGVCFATAQGLYETLKQYNPNSYLIPNGANFELFNKVAQLKDNLPEAGEKNAENAGKRPVMGFVGMVQDCTDQKCLRAAADAYPEGKLIVIGRNLPGVDTSLLQAPNIELRQPVPQDQLPEVMKDFDVCLNCFADNDLSKDVSPLKFYEYLATGIPVVSTPVPLQVRDFGDSIYIASGAEDFAQKVSEAVSEAPGDPRREKRIAYARSCSWEERVKSIREKVGL